jgi:hypothetical protein
MQTFECKPCGLAVTAEAVRGSMRPLLENIIPIHGRITAHAVSPAIDLPGPVKGPLGNEVRLPCREGQLKEQIVVRHLPIVISV